MSAGMLAVDFGTSNSAAAVLAGDRPHRLPIETGADTLPTAVFFPADGGAMRIGTAAGKALVAGEEGRYMRALKSILGTSLFHEPRPIGGRRQTLAEIVTAFLVAVKRRAEAETGRTFTQVLSGRPVRFHSADPERDAQAEVDLRRCYGDAGFDSVRFLREPEAAARAVQGLGTPGEIGLIVDIGGGTSDFSVFRARADGVSILASHGLRLGGTDFDHAVSMAHAMPLLGHGGLLRRTFGTETLPMPRAIFHDLATWARIPFLYTRETERAVADLLDHALEPDKLERLRDVIVERLGHDLAFAVEAGKIAANRGEAAARLDMGFIEAKLAATVSPASLEVALEGYGTRLRDAVVETLKAAGVAPGGVDAVVLVGGSSLMGLVSSVVGQVCPAADVRHSEAFTAVVDGLALATGDPDTSVG